MSLLEDFRSLPPSQGDHLLSALFYQQQREELVNKLEETLQKVKKIENPIKRTALSHRYFSLKRHLEEVAEDDQSIISSLFFVSADHLYYYPLKAAELKIIRDYGVRPFITLTGETFEIEHFRYLLDNDQFQYSFLLDKSNYQIVEWDAAKDRVVEAGKCSKDDLPTHFQLIRSKYNYRDCIYLYGSGPIWDKIATYPLTAPYLLLEKSVYGRNELNEIHERETMKRNHLLLSQRLAEVSDERKIDLFVFGRLKFEIKEAIEAYSLKELFIQKHKYEKLREWIDADAFNFKVIFIEKLENGDVADQFIQNYNGLMGVKYFA